MTRAIIFFIVAAVALYWACKTLFFPKRKTIKAQKAMVFALLSLSALMSVLALYSVPGCEGKVWVDALHIVLAPLCPFLYYIFIRFLTAKEGVTAKNFVLTLPIIALWVAVFFLDITPGTDAWASAIGAYTSGSLAGLPINFRASFWLLKVFVAVEFVVALLYGYYQLKSYHGEVENYYSELIGFADSMDKYVGIYTWISLFVSIAISLSISTISNASSPLIIVFLLVAAIILYFIGSYTYGIEQSTEDLMEMLERDNKAEAERKAKEAAEASEAPKNSMAKYSAALKEALANQIYLEPGLELVDLAERLGTNRTYLSNIIHDEYGQNFAEFINSRRIQYAIELMQNSDEQYPMRYVAVKCGYSSLQTFYSNFARYTGGKTPASFLKK